MDLEFCKDKKTRDNTNYMDVTKMFDALRERRHNLHSISGVKSVFATSRGLPARVLATMALDRQLRPHYRPGRPARVCHTLQRSLIVTHTVMQTQTCL